MHRHPNPYPVLQRLWSICLSLALLLVPGVCVANYTVKIPLADGFDIPVGKPDGKGYYIFRGYWPNGHLGEDWNGNGGGNTDLGDPVYSMADGVVTYSDNFRKGWGNVVIIRHAYRETDGKITYIDSLYGHLDKRLVKQYQKIKRGQQIGTIGSNFGMYAAHLHFEIRKNLNIGMNRSAFKRDYSNYHSPKVFVAAHRTCRSQGEEVQVPVDTYGKSSNVASTAPDSEGKQIASTVPARQTPKVDLEQESRKKREEQLQRLVAENKKKVDQMKDDDMDEFWKKLKSKLGDKK